VVSHTLILAGRIAAARSEPLPPDHWARARAVLGPEAMNSRNWRVLEPTALACMLGGQPEVAAPLIARLKSFGYRPADPFNAVTLGLAE
jgi:hypothetical protein